jgi:hypothetical protein
MKLYQVTIWPEAGGVAREKIQAATSIDALLRALEAVREHGVSAARVQLSGEVPEEHPCVSCRLADADGEVEDGEEDPRR